ncbi:hypothetical protein LC608_36750, partial [Nostoc sp. XA010]|uniref:hypothetical protein n=1 Tax=Nostoc sp. XA010 TaxID=2780407 RepID=UPI001E49CDED
RSGTRKTVSEKNFTTWTRFLAAFRMLRRAPTAKKSINTRNNNNLHIFEVFLKMSVDVSG